MHKMEMPEMTAPSLRPAREPIARRQLLAAVLCTLGAIAPPSLAQSPTTQAGPQPDPILAERLADLASEGLKTTVLTTSMYRQSGLLLEGASRLNPAEPRFHRLRHEALLQAGDIPGAIDALVAYARLEPTDLQAQAKIIELYTQRIETAEGKLKYLRQDILGTATIPAEIRSHAALLASRVLLERGERTVATALADESTRLNPLNAEAQKLRFDLSMQSASSIEKVNGLLAIVRASPLDYRSVAEVAEELSRAGLDESLEWYDAALGLAVRNGTPPDRGFLLNYTSRLLASGQQRDARGLAERILAGDPDDAGAHFIRLSCDRLSGDSASVVADKAAARTSITNGLIEIDRAAGDPTATTMPANTTQSFAAPLPSTIAERIQRKNNPALTDAFVISASDLAWLYLYYLEEDPARVERASQLIDGLKVVLPAESPLLARLEGWLYLVQKKDAEAKVKLTAVEETDPLASIGLLRLETDTQAAGTRARRLRSEFSHGVVGAIVGGELSSQKVPLVLSTAGESIRQRLLTFPKQILRLIDSPQSFYFLRAEPLSPTVEYGSPVLVRVTLVNSSEMDLPLGPQGAIRNDLWFDAQTRGLTSVSFPATAFDRLSGPLVLHPRQAATRVVRIDQGRLLAYLRGNPFLSIPVTGSVITNPAINANNLVPGAGGYQVQFNRFVEQSNVPVATAEQQRTLLSGLSSAPSARRPALIDAAVMSYNLLNSKPETSSSEGAVRLRTAIEALASDPDVTARSWGTFWGLLLSEGDARANKARVAITDSSWLVRMLALCGARGKDITSYRALAEKLQSDPDPLVSRFATAVLDELNQRPPEPPGTQPAK